MGWRTGAWRFGIEPPQEPGVARGDGVVAFIDHDERGRGEPVAFGAAHALAQGLNRRDHHHRHALLSGRRVGVASPQAHDAQVRIPRPAVDPHLSEGLDRLLA